MYLNGLAEHYGFSIDTPVYKLPKECLDKVLYGTGGEKIKFTYSNENGGGSFMASFEGVINSMERRYMETKSDSMKAYYESFMSRNPCPDCNGDRLKKRKPCGFGWQELISELTKLSVAVCIDFSTMLNSQNGKC